MPGFMTGASLAVSSEQQGGVAGLIAAVQGISAVIAPILSTMLYRLDKHVPFAIMGVLVLILSITMVTVLNKPTISNSAIEK